MEFLTYRVHTLVFTAFFLFFALHTSCTTTLDGADEAALIDFYLSTDGPSWRTQSGWLGPGDPCSWYGVTCIDTSDAISRVFGLYLLDNNLVGTIPASFGDMTNISHVILAKNSLYGDIPAQFCSLKSLSVFNVDGNDIGLYPQCLEDFSKIFEFSVQSAKEQEIFSTENMPFLYSAGVAGRMKVEQAVPLHRNPCLTELSLKGTNYGAAYSLALNSIVKFDSNVTSPTGYLQFTTTIPIGVGESNTWLIELLAPEAPHRFTVKGVLSKRGALAVNGSHDFADFQGTSVSGMKLFKLAIPGRLLTGNGQYYFSVMYEVDPHMGFPPNELEYTLNSTYLQDSHITFDFDLFSFDLADNSLVIQSLDVVANSWSLVYFEVDPQRGDDSFVNISAMADPQCAYLYFANTLDYEVGICKFTEEAAEKARGTYYYSSATDVKSVVLGVYAVCNTSFTLTGYQSGTDFIIQVQSRWIQVIVFTLVLFCASVICVMWVIGIWIFYRRRKAKISQKKIQIEYDEI